MRPGDIAFWIRRAVYLSNTWDEMKKWGCAPEEFESFLSIREGWTSCRKKTPERTGWYLVRLSAELWNIKSVPQRMAALYWNGSGWWDSGFVSMECCEAWMPLPEEFGDESADARG